MVGVVAGKSGKDIDDNDILKKVYPVGSIYMSLTDTDPSLLFGGAWEQIEDVFLYAGKVGDANYAPGKTGGEKTHTLTINEIPSHSHIVTDNGHSHTIPCQGGGSSVGPATLDRGNSKYSTDSAKTGISIKNTGGGQPHNNMPPFLAVYMWKRVE